jgi:hypothetical protein
MKKTMWLLTTGFLFVAASLVAQNAPIQDEKKPRLAVLPFSGGDGDDGETIAELFSGSRDLAQIFRIYPRTNIIFGMNEERNVQKYVVSNEEYRNQLLTIGINYVVAGDITRLGQQNLLVISIIDIEKLVQIAGDVKIFEKKQDIEGTLPEMARNIIDGTKIDWADKPKLAVVNPRLQNSADPAAANVLGEILGIEVTRTGKYAVYPRNTTLEAVQAEWDNQRRGAAANPQGPGSADRPDRVLSVIARGGEGSAMASRFNATIINLDTGEQGSFATQTYRNIEDGIAVMRIIAGALTITDAERDAQAVAQAAAAAQAREAAAAVAREKAAAAAAARAREAAAAVARDKAAAAARAREKFLNDRRRFLSFGVQTASWFTTPSLVLSPKFTFSAFPYTFFDISFDIGVLQGYEQKVDYDKYFSLYPSAHLNFFIPFSGDKPGSGWYIGMGAGWLYAYYGNDVSTYTGSFWAFDTTSGFYFGKKHHYFNIAYTFRTNFERTNHKASVGYTFRLY